MKKLFFTIILGIAFFYGYAQNTLPSVKLLSLNGESFSTDSIINSGKPIIISFWATWCKPCMKELNSIADVYEEWQEETGVILVAVSIDDSRTTNQVSSVVKGKAWPYLVLRDPNADFKRAMNVNQVPHTFILDGKRNIVWQHTTFAEGGELLLIDIVKKVAKGEPITE